MKLFQSRFLRNVLVLTGGTAGVQVITLATLPLITRLYGPEAMGNVGLFVATVAIFAPIAALTFPIAIVLPKDDCIARDIAKLSFTVAATFSLILFGILLVYGDWLVNTLELHSIEPYIFLMPCSVFVFALYQILKQWAVRKSKFKVTSSVLVKNAIAVNSFKVIAGIINPTSGVLIVITLAGELLRTLLMAINLKCIFGVGKSKLTLFYLVLRYKDFPMYRAPQVFINAVSQSLPLIMLASVFGSEVAGYFALSKSALMAPVTLVAQAVSDVFYPKITAIINDKGDAKGIIIKATVSLVLVGCIPFAFIILFGPDIFRFVFGEMWVTAGEYAQWISLWLFGVFVTRPVIASIPALNMQRVFLIFEIVSVFVRGGSIWLGYVLFNSDTMVIALYGSVNLMLYLLLIILVVRGLDGRS